MTDKTDRCRRAELDEILAAVDQLLGSGEDRHAAQRPLELLRKRFEHTLIDLGLHPNAGVTAVVLDGEIAVRTRSRRAAEVLLRVLERHADHHVSL